jgi:hypothetical protein
MKAISLVRLAAAAAIFGSIVWQISDRLANDLFRPGEYFAYFTIDSSLIAAVALAVSGVWSWLGRDETRLLHLVRLSVVTSATIVAVVYNALLRGMANSPADGDYVWPVLPNEILHVWGPIVILLDWLLVRGYARLPIKSSFWVLVFPGAWAVFSLIRGLATGWWPYWFIDPTGDGGVSGMLTYIGGIMAFFIVVGIGANFGRRLVSRGL